jgi:hypothetical protein
MLLGKLIGPLGFITATAFGLALLNFFVKWINKKITPEFSSKYKMPVQYYKQFMKLIIKYHKWIGLVAFLSAITHFSIAFASGYLNLLVQSLRLF